MSIASVTDSDKSSLTEHFDQIYRDHARVVFRTAYGITGNRQDAEDVLQAVFLKLLSRGTPQVDGNLKGYLYRAAVNRSLDLLDARRRRPQLLDAHLSATPLTPDDPAFKQEMHRRLYEAMTKLPADTAELLTLRYVHDASDAEIATMLGVSRTVVAVRLFRARSRLRKLIRKSLGEKA
jgi:RNA polymerase sigma factor (sigma-70 family)